MPSNLNIFKNALNYSKIISELLPSIKELNFIRIFKMNFEQVVNLVYKT